MNPKVLISGGGTGGHIFPAIAIANQIKQVYPNAIIEFVGAKGRMEMEKVPLAGYKIHALWISGFQRKFTFQNLLFPIKLISSAITSRQIINAFEPDIVIGTGGFASGPILNAANAKGIKTLIQEQNGFAGITNKILGKKSSIICLGFEEAMQFFPKAKTHVTGNPVREQILNINKVQVQKQDFGIDQNKKVILIVGGSLGAKSINEAIDLGQSQIKEKDVEIIWQTGKNYTVKQSMFKNVYPFITDIEKAYAVADIIISRAGAIAISELCIVAKPVILVPSPNVAEDHQSKNAMGLVNKKAALMVKNSDTKSELINTALQLLDNESLKLTLSENIKKLAKPKATEDIVNLVSKLLEGK